MGSENGWQVLRKAHVAACCAAILALAKAADAFNLPPSFAPFATAVPSSPAPPHLTLIWFDVHHQLPAGIDGMADEVRSIFSEMGVEVASRLGGPGETFGGKPELEIPVILLVQDPSPVRGNCQILGLVMRDQAPVRSVWTFMANIKRAIGLDPNAADQRLSAFQVSLLARAVGRVVAHEVVHTVAPDHPHDGRGLMRHTLSRDMLVRGRGALGKEWARTVLAGLAALPEPGSPRSRTAEVSVAGP